MSESEERVSVPAAGESSIRVNIYDLLLLLLKWRKLIIINFALVVAIAVAAALLLPKWYQGTARILPPSSGAGGLPGFLSRDLAGVAANFGLEVPTDDIYLSILRSRSLRERIVNKYDLREVYKMSPNVIIERVLQVLEGRVSINRMKDQTIEIKAEDQDPEFAATLTNAFVLELDTVFNTISSETARKNLHFIGRRIRSVEDSLKELQEEMVAFQKSTGAISINDQVQAMVLAASDIKAQQIASEVQRDVLRNSFGDDYPLVAQLNESSYELNERYNRIISGREGELFLAISELPAANRRYLDFYRKIQVQLRVLEFIYPQYESARIQESRESANIQVLDWARVPNEKHRPPRKMIVMVAGVASVVISLLLIGIFEYWEGVQTRNPEDWKKIQQIMNTFRTRSRS